MSYTAEYLEHVKDWKVSGIHTKTIGFHDLARTSARYVIIAFESGQKDFELGMLRHPELLPVIRKKVKGLPFSQAREIAMDLVRDNPLEEYEGAWKKLLC